MSACNSGNARKYRLARDTQAVTPAALRSA